MHFFAMDIAEAVGVGVEADGRIEGSFATGESEADVGVSTTTNGCNSRWVLGGGGGRRWGGCGKWGGVYSADNFAFVVPVSFPGADVCPGHAEAFGSGEGGARAG